MDKLQLVKRNADEIQTTFIGFLMAGRVIEIGDVNDKQSREIAHKIVKCVNNHARLIEAIERLLAVSDEANFSVTGGLNEWMDARNLLKEVEATNEQR